MTREAPEGRPGTNAAAARRRVRGRGIWLASALAVALVILPLAKAGPSEASDLMARINAERRARGMGALAHDGEAAGAAQRHAQRMAERGAIFHNDRIGSEVSGWQAIAENVGRGNSTEQIHSTMMGSSKHRSNILGSYSSVGVGVVSANGWLWVSEVFVLRHGDALPQPPPPPRQHRLSVASNAQPKPAPPPPSPPPPKPPPSPSAPAPDEPVELEDVAAAPSLPPHPGVSADARDSGGLAATLGMCFLAALGYLRARRDG